MILIPKAFERVADAASKDTGWSIGAVHVKETDDQIIIEATDGARMIRATLAKKDAFRPEDYPIIPGFDTSVNSTHEAMIPLEDWKKAFKAVPKPRRDNAVPILTCVALTMEQDKATLASTDLETASITPAKSVEGHYPNVDSVIPKDTPTCTIAFDALLLAGTLKALAALTNDGHKPKVRLELHGPMKAARLVVLHAKEDAQVEALIMPTRE